MPPERIKGLKEFHESYYEHSCTVMEHDRDVLKSHIRGQNCSSKLKRWWHGLFLVSYSDERCRTYYSSSEAMKIDRTRQFRHFKGRIHPLSKFRNFWDPLLLILLIINNITIHHNISIVHDQVSIGFYFVGAFIEIFIFIDVILNFKTGYVDKNARKIVLDKYDGVMHYCSTKLFFHVASAIPIQWLIFLRYGTNIACSLCKANYFILTLRSIGVFGMLRTYECSSYLTREWRNIHVTYAMRFLRVFLLGLLTVLFFNGIADKSSLMGMVHDKKVPRDSFYGQALYSKFVVRKPVPDLNFFLKSIYRASQTTMQVELSRDVFLDRCIIIIAFLIVSVFYVWCISELYAYLTIIHYCDNRMQDVKKSSYNMVRCRQLPENVAKKINTYYEFKHTDLKITTNSNHFFMTLPETLKRESYLTTHYRFVKRIPCLSEWPREIIEDIVLLLKEETYLSNDMVAEPWVQSEGLNIVAMGELAVFTGDEERGHMIDGDYFGELSLVTDNELRSSYMMAITPCVILLLDKYDFRKYMRDYPDLFMELKQILEGKATKSKEGSVISSDDSTSL